MSAPQKSTRLEFEKMVLEFSKTAEKAYLPGVSVDTVIFGFNGETLRVLLLRYSDLHFFALPGGYVKQNESLDEAALRLLAERTGLKDVYLEQFFTAGSVGRTKHNVISDALRVSAGSLQSGNWFDQRFISVCYYSLIDEEKIALRVEPFVNEVRWFAPDDLPELLFDHKTIIERALLRLQADLDQNLASFNIMNGKFTMGELQKLYEAICRKKLDRTNFQRRMLSMTLLERLEKKYTGKAYKSPYLYRFRNTGGSNENLSQKS